jgi:hypothetical protein
MSLRARSGFIVAVFVAASAFPSCGGQPWPDVSAPGATPTTTPSASETPSPRGPALQQPRSETIAHCKRTIRSLSSPPAMRTDADFITLMRTLQLPSLPAPGFASLQPELPLGRYPDIDSYIHATPLVSASRTRQLFERDGYIVAEAAGFTLGDNHYGAEGLQFRDSASADEYNRTDIIDLCTYGSVDNLRRIPGVVDGVSFIREDGLTPYRAYLVIGDTVIHLNICSCVTVSDLQSLAERWALRVAHRSAR